MPDSALAEKVRQALAITRDSSSAARTIDVTTTGAKSGRPRRLEIWFYRAFGELYLTTPPARRDWYANIVANPDIVLHLKHRFRADVPATAVPVLDDEHRRRVFADVIADLDRPANPAGMHGRVPPIEQWMTGSPLVHVTPDYDRAQAR